MVLSELMLEDCKISVGFSFLNSWFCFFVGFFLDLMNVFWMLVVEMRNVGGNV